VECTRENTRQRVSVVHPSNGYCIVQSGYIIYLALASVIAFASVGALALSGLVVIVVYGCYHKRSLKEENSVEDNNRELIM
jgi:hypothetical protein